jgi:transposase
MSPEYVQPYVKAQKNDERDAEAIAEAATRPTMRFVELKSQEQLDMRVHSIQFACHGSVLPADCSDQSGSSLLVSIPGIGVTIASALIAAIGKAESFAKGRDLAAWLGLVPKQSTTGGRPRLSRISKRGNKYLRKLLIHGARSALPSIANRDTPLGRWAKGLLARAHKNLVVVALANKLARIAWAVLRRRQTFDVGNLRVMA